MKLGMHKAKHLLPGDITKHGEVVACTGDGWRGIPPLLFTETHGTCTVTFRVPDGSWQRERFALDDEVEVTGQARMRGGEELE